MKKQILLIVGLFIMVNVSAGTALGLKGGLQSSKIYEKLGVYDPLLRTNLGLVCNFAYSAPVSFQMELNYSRKGSNFFDDSKNTIGYLELPLLLKVAGGNEKFKVFGIGGPFIATPMKQESIIKGEKSILTVADDDAMMEMMDLGFQLGGGITYKLGPGRLLAEIRYCQGFGENFVENSYSTNAWQLNVGYLFTFGE